MKKNAFIVSLLLALSIFLIPGYTLDSALSSFNVTRADDVSSDPITTFLVNPFFTIWSKSSIAFSVDASNSSSFSNSIGGPLSYDIIWNGIIKNRTVDIAPNSYAGLNLSLLTPVASGKYSGQIFIYNNSSTNDNVTFNIDVFVPLSFNSSGVGLFAGITNDTYNDTYFFNMSSVEYVAGFRVTIANTSGFPAISLRNGTDLVAIPQQSVYNVTDYKFSEGFVLSQYLDSVTLWSVIAENGTISSFNAALELLPPNFIINDTLGNRIFTIKTNRGNNQTFLLGDFVLNNRTKSNVSYEVSVPVGGSLTTNTNLESGILTGNTGFNFSVTVNATQTGNAAGVYSADMIINSTNGYPYRDLKLTATVNVTSELLGSVLNINSSVAPGGILNLTLNTTYQNGTFVSGLPNSAFMLQAVHRNNNLLSSGTINLTLSNATGDGSTYTLNTTVPSAALGGVYDLYITVSDGLNQRTYLTEFNISDTALKLTITNGQNCVSLNGSPVDVLCKATVTNYGTATANSVNVTPEITGSCLTALNETETGREYGKVSFGDLASGAATTSNFWKFTGSVGVCTLRFVTTSANAKYDVQNSTFSYDFSNTTTTPPTTPGSSGSGSTPLSTPSKKELKITDFPATMEIKPGNTASYTIKVKNSGDFDLRDVALSVSDAIAKSWWSVSTGPQAIVKGTEKSYSITFNIPANASFGDYNIKFVAKGTYSNSTIEGSASSVLKIPASEEAKTEITNNYTAYLERYNQLSQLLNDTIAAGGNVSEIEAKLVEIKAFLDDADAKIKAGDYSAAATALASAYASLNAAEEALNVARANLGLTGLFLTFANNPIPFLAGAVAIIAILFGRFGGKLNLARRGKPASYAPEQKGKPMKAMGAKPPPPAKPQVPQIKQQANKIADKIKNLFKKRQQNYSYSGF